MQDSFLQIVSETIKPKFKSNGFTCSGLSFRKREKEFMIIVDIWKSSWNTSGEKTFWFEVGIHIDLIYTFMFHDNPPKLLRTNSCPIRIRNTNILQDGKDRLNFILTETNSQEVEAELGHHIENDIFPFINQLKNLEDILIINKVDPIYNHNTKLFIGIALSETGNKEKAETLVEEYLSSSSYPESWVNRILTECERIDLKLKWPAANSG